MIFRLGRNDAWFDKAHMQPTDDILRRTNGILPRRLTPS